MAMATANQVLGEGLRMKHKLLGLAAAAGLALTASTTASFAGYVQPGETMGVSLASPLPEGVFFADLEDYGGQNNTPVHIGVNIPVIIWSTPWTFANSRLEFIAAFPFAHIDGGGLDRVGAVTYALGPMLGHDFGNGLTGGIVALVRTPDPSQNVAAITGRRGVEGDFRESLQWVAPGNFFGLSGLTFIENGAYETGFGQSAAILGQNDLFWGDFTIEKTFDKLTVGFTGFGNIDTTNFAATGRERNVELGGLVGYDFGKFTLTGIVTHSIFRGNSTVQAVNGYETRGWVRLIVPLYVAPTPAPVVARY
jgi:hypothetical protein